MESIRRSKIITAAYNPRAISDYARGQLKKSLGKFGLVETLVWNKRTGILVSGHQRLSLMDEKMKYPDKVKDYRLSVSVVDMDERTERELNVFLNNASAQGHFDKDGLIALLGEGIALEDMGFTAADLEIEFGGFDDLESAFAKEETAGAELKSNIDDIKKRKEEVNKKNADSEEEDADYFLMVVFDSRKKKEQWLSEHKFQTTSKFVSADEMVAACSKK